MEKYPLIIEKDSNYAFVIKESKKLTFDLIRKYSTEFYRMLPNEIQERLYDEILHGACELDSEPKLNAYMYALGKMHNAKLYKAYSNLSDEFRNEKTIDIIDYGCGQGMGCISYSDFLRENNLQQKVRRIILIEPSKKALERAALNVSAMYPKTELITINKGFDDLCSEDLFPDKDIPTLHIISNVLDMATTCDSDGFFDLEDFANLISTTIDGKNEFVCVEPLFGYEPKDEKVDAFINKAGINTYYTLTKGKGEFVNGKDWTCVIRVGKIQRNNPVKELKKRNTKNIDELKASQGGSKLDFIIGEGKGAGKLFFSCGNFQGYVSKKAQTLIEANKSDPQNIKDQLEYAEILIIDSDTGDDVWLPTIYPKSVGFSINTLIQKAEQGDASAQLNLGFYYYNGKGVEQDYEKAVFWFRKSAEQGNLTAQTHLGYCYDKGLGVEQNYEKAVEWYAKSAEQGNLTAQNNLGYCYKNGLGVEKDYKKAVFWFSKSAEQGNAAAMYNIGVCYEHGCGVEMDYEEAIKYYQKAADKGIKKAFISIEDLNKKRKLEKSEFIINGHEYVDLGLPSGLKWATCNVGANTPEEYGDYYAWGETETKDEYTYENSSTCYKQMNDISGNPKYDVARKKWGGKWRMPTYDEMEELTTECVWTWKIQNGIKGCKVEGPNGNSIFLPVAGLYGAASLYDAGGFGCYWSSTPYYYNDFAYSLNFVYTSISNNNSYRILGMTIRPVTE